MVFESGPDRRSEARRERDTPRAWLQCSHPVTCHAKAERTRIYNQVAIDSLKQIQSATQPEVKLEAPRTRRDSDRTPDAIDRR